MSQVKGGNSTYIVPWIQPFNGVNSSRRFSAAFLSNFQPFHGFTFYEVRFDDLIDIFLVHIGVADAIRIDHAGRSFLAAIQAARLIHTQFPRAGQAERFCLLFRVIAHLCGTTHIARGPVRTRPPVIDAKENMTLLKTHACIVRSEVINKIGCELGISVINRTRWQLGVITPLECCLDRKL